MRRRVHRTEEGLAPIALLAVGGLALTMSLFAVVAIVVPMAASSVNPAQACTDANAAAASASGAALDAPPVVRGTGIRLQTGVTGMANLYQWAQFTLKSVAIGANRPETDVATSEHIVAMIAWAWAEGGGIKGNAGRFNPLNRRSADPSLGGVSSARGATSDYPTLDAGVEVAARTIEGQYQTRIRIALLNPATTADQVLYAIAHPNEYPGNKIWAEAPNYWDMLQKVLAGTRANFFARANEPLRAKGDPLVLAPPAQLPLAPTSPVQGGDAGQSGEIPGFEGLTQAQVKEVQDACEKEGKTLVRANGTPASQPGGVGTGGNAPAGDGSAGWIAVQSAFKYLGFHYQWGGGRSGSPKDPNAAGMDCSGLMIVAFNDIGVNMQALGGYNAASQGRVGQRIGTNLRDARGGDMVIVNGGQHVGMFVKWDGNTPMWIESSGGSRCSGPSNWYQCKGVVYRKFWPTSIVSINRVVCGVGADGKPIVCGR
ncbi:MAG: NlpC/P60 family protein [Acidimicrobiia bacterium]